MQENEREPAQEEGKKSILEALHDQISFLEKWNIAARMQGCLYSYPEIAHFTGLEAHNLDRSPKEFVRVCRLLKQAIEKSFFGEKLVKLLGSIGEEKEGGDSVFKKIYQDTAKEAKRMTRLQIAYKMLLYEIKRSWDRVYLDGIASLSRLSVEDVKSLVDLRRICIQQERKTKKEIAQRSLQAQLNRDTVAKIVGLNPSKLDELLSEKEEEDTFTYSFLHREKRP